MPDYSPSFGLNIAPFLQGVAQMDAATDQLTASITQANADMQAAANETARSNTQMRQTVLDNVGAARSLRQEYASGVIPDLQRVQQVTAALQANLEALRQKQATALDPALVASYGRQITILQTQLTGLNTTFANTRGPNFTPAVGIIGNLEAALGRMRQQLVSATDPGQITNFNRTISALEGQLRQYRTLGLDPASAGTRNLGATLSGVAPGANRAGQSLTDMGRILQDLPFGFVAISNNLSPMLESFQRLRAETGSTGGALRALISGVSGAGGLGLAFSAVTSILTFASVGMQAWKGHVQAAKQATDEAKKENENYTESLDNISKALLKGQIEASKELISLDNLYRATQNQNLAQSSRLAAANELIKKYPDIFTGLNSEAILAGKAAAAYENLKDQIVAGARARAAGSILEQQQQAKLVNEQRIADLRAEKEAIGKRATNRVSGVNDGSGVSVGNAGVALQAEADRVEADKKIVSLVLANKKIDEESKRLTDTIDALQVKGAGVVTGSFNIETEAAKKAAAALKKGTSDAEKENKLREEQERAFTDLMAKIINERAQLGAKAIADDRESQLAASDAKFKQQERDLLRNVDEAKVNEDQRAKLREAANLAILDAERAAAEARADINARYDAKELVLKQRAADAIALLNDNKQDEEIRKLNKHYQDLTKTIQDGGAFNVAIEKQIAEQQAREIADIKIKYGTQQIKKETDLAVATVKVSEQYAHKGPEIERQKQLAILQEQLKGAEAQLALLEVNGKTQNDLEVKQAEETIDNIKQAIANNTASGKNKQSLFAALGIDAKGEEDIKKYGEAASAAGRITADFLGALSDAVQKQIDKKQELIDQENRALDDLESRLDKEKELRDAGLANNVDGLQKELDAKKAQRDEDLKQQEELQKRQEKIKKAQVIADSISQVSNLITASTQIFATFASIPFVGVPLAIAAIGLMLGAFTVAKVNAFKSVSAGNKMATGGLVDGKKHTAGGKKYVSMDGTGAVKELEAGEFVTRADKTEKAKTLLHAINSGELWTINDDSLRGMLAGMGIKMSGPEAGIKKVRESVRLTQKVQLQAAPPDISKDIKNISGNVGYLAEKERGRITRWEDQNYYYTQQGSKTTREKKTNEGPAK